ncbi:MAG: DUF2070 family protein [Thaumarchaeota archaeon]|nr:DUF2070 family protein [Nitrososphaerota archaeon]
MLPSAPLLLLYCGLVSLLLSVVVGGKGVPLLFASSFAVFVLSASAVSGALRTADRHSIGNFRRTAAVLLTGEAIWLFFSSLGLAFGRLSGSNPPLANAIVFGALVCAGVEFLVINGAFTGSTILSLLLSGVHPGATLVLMYLNGFGGMDPTAATLGVLAFIVIAAFIPLLKRRKTSRGHSALSLFRSFMKTWAGGESAELEAIISDHSEEADVTTKVLRFQTKGADTLLVFPGVHPGPFHPIGSYDLPGVVSKAFAGLGNAMTFHRPGGHEKNLATKAETQRFASLAAEFTKSIVTREGVQMRGPMRAQIGNASVTSSAFADDLIVTISFAPLGSDDLNAAVEDELARPASIAGFEASIVDSHNSIDHRQVSPDTADSSWELLFEKMKQEETRPFMVAYSHSSELGFPPAEDLTENGVGLLMVESAGMKQVLALADANNAVPRLKGEVAAALEASGFGLLEFCTSDSHNLAARGLTVARGYKALGEETSVESIVKLILEMAKLAEGRLVPVRYGSGQISSKVRVFGSRALEEFADITQASSKFGSRYLRAAAASVGALLLLSLLL